MDESLLITGIINLKDPNREILHNLFLKRVIKNMGYNFFLKFYENNKVFTRWDKERSIEVCKLREEHRKNLLNTGHDYFFIIDSDVILCYDNTVLDLFKLFKKYELDHLCIWEHTNPSLYSNFTTCGIDSDKLDYTKNIQECTNIGDAYIISRKALELGDYKFIGSGGCAESM